MGLLSKTIRWAFVAIALGAGVAFAVAQARPATLTLHSARNATLGQTIVVSHGRTLYRLKPETTRHLLCTGQCLQFWHPLTVRSTSTRLRDGAGVTGRIRTFRRRGGILQVTLRGLPLYTFAGDTRAGQANGQHIHSFGGTWEVLPASTSHAAPQQQQPTMTTPGYGPPY